MSDEVITAYSHSLRPVAQHQHLPGLDSKMNPIAEWTRLEQWDNDGKPYLAEYVGSGKLAGKSCLVTGGDSGIGRSAAVMMAREGADISIVYQPEEQTDAEDVRKSIEEAGRRCLLLPGDLTDRAFCEEVVNKHVKEYGGINVLVNNAAKQGMEPDIGNIDLDFTELTFKTNILAIFALTKFAVPHMKRGASIINSTSVGAYLGEPMAMKIDYSSTKGAIVSFTRSLSAQLAPKGIRVNMVAPGPIWTPLNVATRNQPADVTEDFTFKGTPLHGRMGQPAELGPSYVFLASADSNYMTGQAIHVSAGLWTGS